MLPVVSAIAALLLALLPAAGVLAAGWTAPERVTPKPGSRMDSLHQLASAEGTLHLVHARIGPAAMDDRVVYQRSRNGGAGWSSERAVFRSGARHRHVVPNLAIAARGSLVAIAWRVRGPGGTTLFLRLSRDTGDTFAPRQVIAARSRDAALGVPAVAVGRGVLAVAWTERRDGAIRVRSSLDGGRTFSSARTLGRTTLSIACRAEVRDGLVGLAAAGPRLHVAWSSAGPGGCIATRVKSRSSADQGSTWRVAREVTVRSSYGWPELASRGRTVLASLQLLAGRLLVARSRDGGRTWTERVFERPRGRSLGSGDVTLLAGGTAWLAYVDERYEDGQLARTRLLVRRSSDGGRTWGRARVVVADRARSRQAPNVAAAGMAPALVFQSGPLSESRRDLLITRRPS